MIKKCVFVLCFLIGILIIVNCVHQERQKELFWEQLEKEVEEINRLERERLAKIKYERGLAERQRYDSIYRANIPSYSFEDVEKMVRSKVPSYSEIHLWKLNKDNWIMKYYRYKGNRFHHYMRWFNPTTKKFEKEFEVKVYEYDYRDRLDKVEFGYESKDDKKEYFEDISHRLSFYGPDGYVRLDRAARLRETSSHPVSKKLNGYRGYNEYEDAEDCYYDNAEDLYLYYGGEY